MMPVGDFFGSRKKYHASLKVKLCLFDITLCLFDGVATQLGMGLHNNPFIGRKPAGFE